MDQTNFREQPGFLKPRLRINALTARATNATSSSPALHFNQLLALLCAPLCAPPFSPLPPFVE